MRQLKSFFVFASIISLLHLNSCDVDKLELINPNELTTETFFKTEAQVQQPVTAVYANLQTDGLYQRTLYYSMDFMAFEQLNTIDPIFHIFLRYSFDANTVFIAKYWKSCYAGIRSANFVIDNEEAINRIPEGLMPQVKKSKYLGEARFLRALYYFLLVTRFGDVPLIIAKQDGNTGLPRSPKSIIWSQIETDLSFAAENCLPKNIEEKGRATSGAAWALLGKAHLFQANESNDPADFFAARNAFLQVIDDHENYDLEARYDNNFEEETEHGPESVFEVEFNAALGYGDLWSSDDNGAGLNECSLRGIEYGCFNWYNAYPFSDLVEEFETVADNGVKNDPRLGYCIYQTGDLYNNGKDTAVLYSDTTSYWMDNVQHNEIRFQYGWKKYQNYYKQKSEGSYSGINTRVIRLADVLLMMAEVENELGKIPEAIRYLNMVRNRADVMMPNYGTPAMNNIYPVSNQQQLRKAIEHERKIELCNEQVRINDLIRWHRLEAFIREEAMPKLPYYMKKALMFDPAKHYLWPVPQSEIDSNPAITQHDQNYGY